MVVRHANNNGSESDTAGQSSENESTTDYDIIIRIRGKGVLV